MKYDKKYHLNIVLNIASNQNKSITVNSFISNNPYIFILKFISILWKISMILFNILINL